MTSYLLCKKCHVLQWQIEEENIVGFVNVCERYQGVLELENSTLSAQKRDFFDSC